MKRKQQLLMAAFCMAAVGAVCTASFAEGKTIDCSQPSKKECARVDVPGGSTVIHYGTAKATSIENP